MLTLTDPSLLRNQLYIDGAWVAPLVVETAGQTGTGCEGTVDGCLPSARQVPRPSLSSKAAIWLAEQMQRSSAAFARQATCTLSTPAGLT